MAYFEGIEMTGGYASGNNDKKMKLGTVGVPNHGMEIKLAEDGGLFGLSNGEIPSKWTDPWSGKVNTTISGIGELSLENLIQRTELLQENISSQLKKS